jgi:hypothetical protein
MKAIAQNFNLQPKDARYALQKSNTIPKGRCEHQALEEDTKKPPLELVKKNAQNCTAVNRTEF